MLAHPSELKLLKVADGSLSPTLGSALVDMESDREFEERKDFLSDERTTREEESIRSE